MLYKYSKLASAKTSSIDYIGNRNMYYRYILLIVVPNIYVLIIISNIYICIQYLNNYGCESKIIFKNTILGSAKLFKKDYKYVFIILYIVD